MSAALIVVSIGLAGYSLLRVWQSMEVAESESLFQENTTSHRSKPSSVRQTLQTLNWRVEPLMLAAILLAVGFCVFFVFLEFFPESIALAALSGGALTLVTFFVITDASSFIRHIFEQKLIDALDLIQAAVAGGVSPQRAMQVAANASRGAVARELNEVVDRLDYGLPIEEAVERMRYRYDSEGVRLFRQALLAKWHSGTDFAPLLKSVSGLLRERVKLRIQIDGQLSGSRYAALFAGALPYLLVPLFFWKEPNWFEPLKNSENGATYLLAGILSQVVGYLWLRRILRSGL